jgi:hypothetical protein
VVLNSLKSLNLTKLYPNNKNNKNNNKNNNVKSKPLELYELAGKKLEFFFLGGGPEIYDRGPGGDFFRGGWPPPCHTPVAMYVISYPILQPVEMRLS